MKSTTRPRSIRAARLVAPPALLAALLAASLAAFLGATRAMAHPRRDNPPYTGIGHPTVPPPKRVLEPLVPTFLALLESYLALPAGRQPTFVQWAFMHGIRDPMTLTALGRLYEAWLARTGPFTPPPPEGFISGATA